MEMLEIKNLYVSVEDKEILSGINLIVKKGEIHALMGPNGNGKSTLLQTIMGNPNYHVTNGEILLDGINVLNMSVDERSKAGIFLGMQYPQEIDGVTNSDFLKAAINARREKPISLYEFIKTMDQAINSMEMKPDLAHRFVNAGFSGGEKKRNEIVQMMLLKPQVAMLDEIDSGLDVDALKIVASSILQQAQTTEMALLVVSHYERFFNLLKPTHAHVLVNGKIVVEGDASLVDKIDTEGYEWLSKEYQINLQEEPKTGTRISLEVCGAKKNNG